MKKTLWLLAVPVLGLGAWAATAAVNAASGEDENVAPDSVPPAVLEAARNAVPGFVLVVAEKELEGGGLVYSLEGFADGKSIEVEVTSDGEVVEIESGDDPDDEDETDDNDD